MRSGSSIKSSSLALVVPAVASGCSPDASPLMAATPEPSVADPAPAPELAPGAVH